MDDLDFLPNPVNYDGNWDDFIKQLYKIFKNDFLKTRLTLKGKSVRIDKRKIDDPREEGFWHLITKKEERNAGDRLPDIQRAEKLSWIRPLIENHNSESITYWKYLEGRGCVRHYIWAKSVDFVVILEERRKSFFLVTAFNVDSDWKRANLENRYQKRLA